jgi:hypothetical protein
VITDIVRDYPCTRLNFKLVAAQRGDFPEHSCSLVKFAASRFSSTAARRLGIAAGDTARIISAAISYFSFEDLSGGPPERYWSVSFRFPKRSLPIVVRIDQMTGQTSMANGEGSPDRL